MTTIRKEYGRNMEKIMNEENEWDHITEVDLVKDLWRLLVRKWKQ